MQSLTNSSSVGRTRPTLGREEPFATKQMLRKKRSSPQHRWMSKNIQKNATLSDIVSRRACFNSDSFIAKPPCIRLKGTKDHSIPGRTGGEADR